MPNIQSWIHKNCLIKLLFLSGLLFGMAAETHAQSFTQVAVGLAHLCGLSTDGSVDCRTQPSAVRYDAPDDLPPLVAITAGHQHTCGVDEQGDVICWGGLNYFNEQDVPAIDQPVVSLSAGVSHTCAVDATSRVWCWGLNNNDQLDVPGNGLGMDGSGFLKVAANNNTSCGLTTTGNIDCWSTDTSVNNTSQLSGTFVDLDIAERLGCGLRDDGSIQCWASAFAPPDNGPYSEIVVGAAAICALNTDQQLDCTIDPRAQANASRYLTSTMFTTLESGKLRGSADANICGVTVDGAIECIAVDALPEVPGSPEEDVSELLDIGLNARIYSTNSIELFWKPSRGIRPRFVEVYRDDELVTTSNARFSWYDSSVQQNDTVKYTVRAMDEFGNFGLMSNAVFIDNSTLVVTDESILEASGEIFPEYPIENLFVASLATEVIVAWDGKTPGTEGLKGYEVRMNGETVALTTNTFYTSSQFINGACNVVAVTAIADDGTRLNQASYSFRRTATSFGGVGC